MTLPLATSFPADVPPVPQAKALGHVISVRGSQASVGIPASAQTPEERRATVGKFLGLRAGKSLLVGLIADVSMGADPTQRDSNHLALAQLDLIGEIHNHGTPAAKFERGVSTYPAIGDAVTAIGWEKISLCFSSADCMSSWRGR